MTTDAELPGVGDELARAEYVQENAYSTPIEPAPEPPRPEWVTVLASGGDEVYLFDARDKVVIDGMEAVLDVAYPAADTVRQTIAFGRWPAVRDALLAEGVEIVDRSVKEDDQECHREAE